MKKLHLGGIGMNAVRIPGRLLRRTRMAITGGWLEGNSRDFRQLFTGDARIRKVATGFQFTEGPVWIREEKALLFSDIPADKIYRIDEDGRVSVFRAPSGHSNGLTRDRQGRLIVCEHGGRRVSRIEKDGSVTVLAEQFGGKKLNSPNDVIVKSDGAIYFTDPPYGIQPEEQEQPVQGVYRISPGGRDVSLVADDLDRPNGLAFSPDERRLYVADSSKRRHLRVFDVREDGSLADRGVFVDMSRRASGVPDGLKVDSEGHLFCTGPGGVWVLDPAGVHLGTIVTPEPPSNCCWGSEDGKSLYITARTSVYTIRVRISGKLMLPAVHHYSVGKVSE